MFRMPEDGYTFISEVNERCADLISYGIWNGVQITKFRKWLSNFNTDEEKYFAARILDFLIYRSEDQTISMMRQLIQRVLPDLNRKDKMPIGEIGNFELRIKRPLKSDPLIRFITVIEKSDPHSKSSPTVVRFLKRRLLVDESLIIKPWDIERSLKIGVRVFIFIDDFLGTGNQFKGFILNEGLEKHFNSAYFVYIPLAATTEGISNLQRIFPEIRLSSVEILDQSYSLFNDECSCFQDNLNTPKIAREFYFNLLDEKGIKINGPNRRGYGACELAYAFSHAIPDNCIPLLWWTESDIFFNLFDR